MPKLPQGLPDITLENTVKSFTGAQCAWIVLGIGLVLQLWLWSRGWVPLPEPEPAATAPTCEIAKLASYPPFLRDQVHLVGAGLEWVETGELRPAVKKMSGGAFIPGSLLQVFIGAPLWLWLDYRAASLLLVPLHLLAAFLLLRVTREAGGGRFAAVFMLLFWLSPWRLYHSGFIWEPAYVLLPGGLHLWACWRSRSKPTRGASFVLGAITTAAPQLHASAVVLVAMTGWLAVRRRIRLCWSAVTAGLVAGAISLLPTISAFLGGPLPALAPSESSFASGLLNGYPLLRAFAYWFRLGSLDIGRRLRQTSFWEGSGEAELVTLDVTRLFMLVLVSAAIASIFLSLIASWRYLRSASPSRHPFLQGYARCAFGTTLAAAALSPVTLQGWHLLLILPAACLPLAMWLSDSLDHSPRRALALCAVLALLQVTIALTLGLGHPMYGEVVPGDCLPRAVPG